MAPFSTEFVARAMIEDRQRALARIDREAWRLDPFRGTAPAGEARRRIGLCLIRAGAWIAGLPRQPVAGHRWQPFGQTGRE